MWIEKTLVAGRPDRESGDYALGKALWSPKVSASGGEVYRFMREVQEGDVILHLTDNDAIVGRSEAASVAQDFVGLPNTQWAAREAFLIPLRNYRQLEPPFSRDVFFGDPFGKRLAKIAESGVRNLFFNSGPALNQGAYLTPVPTEVLAVLNDAYRTVSGHALIEDDELGVLTQREELRRAAMSSP